MPKNTEKTKRKLPEPDVDDHDEEDWCFECKDGGQLVLCDHKNCGKAYHPDCVGKDDSFFDTVKSWVCGRHCCYNCDNRSKFCCLGCPNAVCKKCVSTLEFTVVRGVQGLCCDCLEIVQIIERNLDHDSEGNKITLDDRETYECLFKEYWGIVKSREGLTEDDVSAALSNYRKGKDFELHTSHSEGEEEEEEEEEEKQHDTNSNKDDTGMHKPKKQKQNQYSSMEFVGWASRPLSIFLASIGRYETEPMMLWGIKSLIYEYIKEKNLYHPKDKRKFLPDDKLFPIFKKNVVSKYQIYSLLEFHIAKKSDDSSGKVNRDQRKIGLTDKDIDDQTCLESRLSSLIEKPLLRKGDICIKPGCFASINVNNIALIYLKQSLVQELSKQTESFVSKVVGTFVRARVDPKQKNLYHLVRVIDVVHDEMSNGVLLEVSFMPKAISISELSDLDFTEKECEDLRQKVNTGLLPKLTVDDLQEKATSLHEDITKHWIATRLVYLQIKIERASLRGRNKEKVALLNEREELERPWKQEQLLRRVPSVFPELMEVKYGDSDEESGEANSQDHDSVGNKISLGDKETHECLFKEYEKNVKLREGMSEDDISAALPNKRKGKKEKQSDSNSNEDYAGMHKPNKRKRYSSGGFVGWASGPLSRFLASIGRYETEPMMRREVKSLIFEYIKEKNLYHPKDKKKFFPDDKLFPIFQKEVMSKYKIYSLLKFHIAGKSDDSAGKENHDQNKNCSTENKHIDDETCMGSRLSSLIEKPLLKKGDICIKPGCFASINANNIRFIYLKRSLVFELSKQPGNFVSKVVGTFVRAKVDSNDHKLRNSYHLVRVIGVEYGEMSNGILLQVSFMPKAISISELSDDDFKEQECEDLQQKVNTGLLPKITVGDLQEKATSLHEDITKHWIAKRLVHLQIQIERANLRGRNKDTKIALLDEREELAQPSKQEQLLRRVPLVFPELMEVKYDDSDEDSGETNN